MTVGKWILKAALSFVGITHGLVIMAGLTTTMDASAEAPIENDVSFRVPLRINMAFFDKNLAGTVQVFTSGAASGSANDPAYETSSAVNWQVLPPPGPAPTGDYLADFRDRPGCAGFRQADGVELCFNVVPDVSSLDVTKEAVSAKGVAELLQSQVEECAFTGVTSVAFETAAKGQGELTVDFAAQCSDQPYTVRMNLKEI